MSDWLVNFFWYCSMATYVLSITAVVVFRTNLPKVVLRLLLAYLLLALVTEIVNLTLIRLFKLYSCYTFSIYEILGGTIILLLYRSQFVIPAFKRLLAVTLFVYVIFASYEIYLIYAGIDLTREGAHVFLNIAVICFSVLYFYQTLMKPAYQRIEKQVFFWINSAFFTLYGATLFLWLFSATITMEVGDLTLYRYLWPIQNFATIIFNGLIIIAAWRTKRISC